MEGLEKIERWVISYREIPHELTEDHWLTEKSCDCFVEFEVTDRNTQEQYKKEGYSDDFLIENYIIDRYPQLEGQIIFIEIDY